MISEIKGNQREYNKENFLFRVVVILLNFEIIGNADEDPVSHDEEVSKPKENIEPKVNAPVKKATMDSKSFFNKKDEKPVSNVGPAGTFNGHKIFGISSLNPYQNKLEFVSI